MYASIVCTLLRINRAARVNSGDDRDEKKAGREAVHRAAARALAMVGRRTYVRRTPLYTYIDE